MESAAAEIGLLKRFELVSANPAKLVVEASDAATSPVLDDFFTGYDEAFVLPDEKESLQGFRECLALNHGAAYEALANRYGPFREIVLVVREATGNAPIGGASFIAFLLAHPRPTLTLNLSYLYIDPRMRGRGYLRPMLDAVEHTARICFEPPARVQPSLTFIEQNDPLKMSPEDYARDTEHSGLDQMTRIGIWSKQGARILDFDYIQPPLSPAQQPDSNLVYGVLGAEGHSLDPCLLAEHLKRFFAISVLKGGDPSGDVVASAQISALAAACAHGKMIPLLQARGLVSGKDEMLQKAGVANGLRTWLRALPENRNPPE